MAINLDNFVNVSIKYHLTGKSIGNRDTVVLIVEGTQDKEKLYDKLSEFVKDYPGATDTSEPNRLYYYGYTYFNNGGLKLLVKTVATNSTDITSKINASNFATYLANTNPALCTLNGDTYTPVASDAEYDSSVEYYFVSNTYTEDKTVTADNFNNKKSTLYKLEDGEYVSVAEETYVEGTIYYTHDTLGTKASPLYSDILVDIVKALDMEYIVIASTASYDVMNTVAGKINVPVVNEDDEETMIWRKKFISCLPDGETLTLTDEVAEGFIIKYGDLGQEMTIGAYLSQINIDYANSVQDYDYTTEKIAYEYKLNNETKVIGKVYDNNDLVTSLMKSNINVDGTLVGATRNLGGNQLDGRDLVNEYMLIVLNQTLTERLVLLLTKKIKYNSTGLSLIGAEISRELNRYLTNGFLTTDKSWTEEDLVYKNITIITKNTPLKTGFKYVVLPLSVLSSEELAEHKLPPIYVLVADSYSIRKINVVGEVF